MDLASPPQAPLLDPVDLRSRIRHIPRTQPPASASSDALSQEPSVLPHVPHGQALGVVPRVLIIDDDDDLLQMARGILGADGYLVDTAYVAMDGVHKALRFPPDIILLDVLMGECDGLEIFDTLRQHERTCNVPVLALSSLAGRDACRLLLDIGFAALIEKPVDWPVLRRELRSRVASRAVG